MAQQFKDSALSLLQLGFHPWPRKFHMQPKKQEGGGGEKKTPIIHKPYFVLILTIKMVTIYTHSKLERTREVSLNILIPNYLRKKCEFGEKKKKSKCKEM